MPDMKADSDSFVNLLNVYKNKFIADSNTIAASVPEVPRETVDRFCRNIKHIHLVRFRSLAQEYASPQIDAEPSTHMYLYMLFRAAQLFKRQNGRNPGSLDAAADIKALTSLVSDTFRVSAPADLVAEFCRAGGSQLHSMSSFMGGVASQEVIKLLTRQYIPMNHTLIYNGIDSTSSVLKL